MKSIFTKLGTLLCGAVALVGCSDISADLQDLENKVLKNQQDISGLRTELTELTSTLEATYVKKSELQTLSTTVEDLVEAVEDLEALVDSKADAATINNAIKDLQDAVKALKGCTCESTESCTCDLTKIESDIKALQEAVLALKGCTCEPSESCACEPIDLSGINSAITDLQADLDEYKEATDATLKEIKEELAKLDNSELIAKVAEIEAELAGVNDAIVAAIATSEAALRGELATAVEDVKEAFAEADAALAARLDAVETALANTYTKDEADAAIAAAVAQYAGLNDKLADLEAQLKALAGVVDALATELRGIVMVPQILVNGTPAIEFKSFVYVPMAADNDEYVSAEGAADAVVVGDPATVAYYHFNPSNFDVASATYSLVSTQVETRATAEPVGTVGKVENVDGKVKVELLRGKGTDNMFALAATLKNGAVITSDYALVLDAKTTADALVIVDNNDTPLYATLAEAEENAAQIDLNSSDSFNFSDYVKAIDPAYAAYGVEYKYSLVHTNSEDVTVAEDGTADFKWADGVQVVKVEAVLGEDVVRRAYVKVYVNFVEPELPGIYYAADAVATVEASRVAFEVKDIYTWAKALKDEPNTIEILKEVYAIVENIAEIAQSEEVELQKEYLIRQELEKAYVLLNGVPGFVYKYKTFTGEGSGKAKVELLPEITTIAELKAVVEMLEEEYTADLTDKLTHSIINLVPESVKGNFIVDAILERLEGFQISDLLENETVLNLLNTAQSAAQKYFGIDILDFSKVNDFLESVLIDHVGENRYGEEAAKITAQAKARAAAEEALKAEYTAANEQLMTNFMNGTWGQLYDFINVDLNLDNEYVAKILEYFELTDTVNALVELVDQIISKGEDLVKYTYDADNIVYDIQVERYEVK